MRFIDGTLLLSLNRSTVSKFWIFVCIIIKSYLFIFFYWIIAIINANYETLELVTPEKLDHYTPYNEIPYHVPLLRQVLRVIVEDFKKRDVLLY